jgi:hypothetical protein
VSSRSFEDRKLRCADCSDCWGDRCVTMENDTIGSFVRFLNYRSSFCLSDDGLGGVNIKLQQPFNDSCFLVG